MFSGRRWLLQHRHRRLGLLGVTDLWICVLIVTLSLDLSLVSHAVIDTEGSIVGVLIFGDFVDRSVCDGSICFEP